MIKPTLFITLIAVITFTTAQDILNVKNRPADFVDIKEVIPQVQTDMRYFSKHNFVGEKIPGYKKPVCLLTKHAANALKTVVEQLVPMGLTLKVYDCYRPQIAVDAFKRWALQLHDIRMRTEFYPHVDKQNLFKDGYIAANSGHSRGSTVDLTIVPLNSKIPPYMPKVRQVSCLSSQNMRAPDNSLDFGTGYDCFSPAAHPDYQNLSTQSKANRILLQILMKQAGFKPLDTEWWHFTLIDEPYPTTYFDFPVE